MRFQANDTNVHHIYWSDTKNGFQMISKHTNIFFRLCAFGFANESVLTHK